MDLHSKKPLILSITPHIADLLVVDKDIGVVVGALHLLSIGDEVGADVAAVELHTFDDFDGGVDTLGVLDGDDAVLGHFLHGLGDDVTDVGYMWVLYAFFVRIVKSLKTSKMEKAPYKTLKTLVSKPFTIRPFGDPSMVSRRSIFSSCF